MSQIRDTMKKTEYNSDYYKVNEAVGGRVGEEGDRQSYESQFLFWVETGISSTHFPS